MTQHQHGEHQHGQPQHGQHQHGGDHDMTRWLEPGPWEERYAATERHWSGNPNPVLVTEVTGLEPGTALDVGCGEGADVVWLARQGWRTTGVDFSRVGLDKAAAHAREQGVEAEWVQQDLRTWSPPAAAYDLVTSHFLHLPPDELAAVLPRLAAAVAPGGTLLYVGHHPSDLMTGVGRTGREDLMPTAEQVVALLDPDGWTVQVSEARPRLARMPDGVETTIHDAVLRVRRSA